MPPPRPPVTRLELDHFKAFYRYRVDFVGDAYLAGPNNSGKSTVIAALRTGSRLLYRARHRSPDAEWPGSSRPAWSFTPADSGLIEENVRHEFGDVDATLCITFANSCRVLAMWPHTERDGDARPRFTLVEHDGGSPETPSEVRRRFPRIASVPVLSPVEQEEELLSESTVRRHRDGRLTSRYFRNQLYHYGGYGREFEEFIRPWLPELQLEPVTVSTGAEGAFLDVFYLEPPSTREKEIFWSGDGVQIYLQLLWHLFRTNEHATVVLDEPEVFLHPDLQRRLVGLLSEVSPQTITATHSAEVLTEAPAETVIWISRNRERAVNAPVGEVQDELTASLGTGFNLRLARALRANDVVLVEGRDMKILRLLAAAIGAERLALERGVVVERLEGYSNRTSARAFSWLIERFLGTAVTVHVILDSDYRPSEKLAEARNELLAVGARPHIWQRKEIESYLLVAPALARVSGATQLTIEEALQNIAEDLKTTVTARLTQEYVAARRGPKYHPVSATEDALREVEALWADPALRLSRCPAKDVFRGLNRRLQPAGYAAVSPEKVAREIRSDEIDPEVVDLLLGIEASIADDEE